MLLDFFFSFPAVPCFFDTISSFEFMVPPYVCKQEFESQDVDFLELKSLSLDSNLRCTHRSYAPTAIVPAFKLRWILNSEPCDRGAYIKKISGSCRLEHTKKSRKVLRPECGCQHLEIFTLFSNFRLQIKTNFFRSR